MADLQNDVQEMLDRARMLIRRGNVKDGAMDLVEAMALIVMLIEHGQTAPSAAPVPPDDEGLILPADEVTVIDAASLQFGTSEDAPWDTSAPIVIDVEPATALETAVTAVPDKKAPYGYTIFGNPRRLRKKKTEPAS